ncbi:MAG: formylglycine-generating enzyme family protein [Bacteriovoracales bacterium]|nr:formylglycine-generating enzyme family protein [Bacteriovoracales bacterium]
MLLIFGLFAMASAAWSAGDCSKLLQQGDGTERDATDNLKSFLGTLMERQVIGDEGPTRLIEGLKGGKLINPITEEETGVSRIALVHRKTIQRFVDGKEGRIDQKDLLDWARETLKKRKRVRVERTEAKEETKYIYQEIAFHPVKGGKFKMGEGIKEVDVELTHDIEVMSTPVTQKQWAELMGFNPSRFADGEGSQTFEVNGRSIEMRPDNPVEMVSWWEALEFANRLSESHGLKPAYDLSVVRRVLVNAPGGDIYRAEGFRLPTEAEQEYILRAGGVATGRYHFGNDTDELKKYAWLSVNSNGSSQPVGDRLPLVIEGFKFYDVIGNVWEWSWDDWKEKLPGGVNPLNVPGVPPNFAPMIRGGGWSNSAYYLRSAARRYNFVNSGGGGYLGFRLVRTIPNP